MLFLLPIRTFFLILPPFSVISRSSNAEFSSDNGAAVQERLLVIGEVDAIVFDRRIGIFPVFRTPLYEWMSFGVCGRKRKRDSL